MNRWFRLALKLAKKSKHHKCKMAAVVVRSGTVLSVATNGESIPYGQFVWGKHAETRAIYPYVDYTGATIYVARKGPAGPRMSRPCSSCLEKIRQSGITKMVYAGWNGEVITEMIEPEEKKEWDRSIRPVFLSKGRVDACR